MENIKSPGKLRIRLAGILILAAYSMLTYSITGNVFLGFIADVISGLSVIGIPLLLYPVFYVRNNKGLYYAYVCARLIEGGLMLVGAVFLLAPSLRQQRNYIYSDIHIFFFITGALFFYILFYRTNTIPRFISIWGILATIILLTTTIMKQLGFDADLLNIAIVPIVLNEVFLALWLTFRGLKK